MEAFVSKNSLLWLGSGEIANLTIPQLLKQYAITAVSRNHKDLPSAVTQCLLDLKQPQLLDRLLEKIKPKVVVVTLSPGGRSKEAYTGTYLNSMSKLSEFSKQSGWQPDLLLYVSSSSVYGQEHGEWVDELSETIPTSETAQILLATESCIAEQFSSHCIVRFSGIYGRDRTHLFNRLLTQRDHPPKFSNRIHVDDCARVLQFLLEQPFESLPRLLLASDDEPERLDKMSRWLKRKG